MKKFTALAAGLLIGVPTLAVMAAGPAAPGQTSSARRGDLVHSIVMKWGSSVQERTKTDVRTWARLMGPLFNKASLDKLQVAANAKTFQAMENTLLGLPNPPSVLGSTTDDLVFIPIVPCRILDTRPSSGGTGSLAAGETRQFDVTSTNSYAGQGGSPTDCGGLGSGEEAPAVVVNFTTVNPVGAGYITAWPTDGNAVHPKPLAATVNYAGGDIRGNLAIVQLDLGAGYELSVYSLRATNLVGDAVGYFIRPQATALDCVDGAQFDYTVAAGALNLTGYSCDAGYTRTALQCWGDATAVRLRGSVDGLCQFASDGASTIYHNKSTCCRTPGR